MGHFRDTLETRKRSFISALFNLHDCTFNYSYSEAGVIGNIFPLLKPKINSKCIQYDFYDQVTSKERVIYC